MAEFPEAGSSVTSIVVALTDGAPTVRVSVASARRTGQAVFDAEGKLIEVTS